MEKLTTISKKEKEGWVETTGSESNIKYVVNGDKVYAIVAGSQQCYVGFVKDGIAYRPPFFGKPKIIGRVVYEENRNQ